MRSGVFVMSVDEMIKPLYIDGKRILYKKNKNCKEEHKFLCEKVKEERR